MWQDITQTHCLSLAGCSKIHPCQDDTKIMWLAWVQYPAKGFWEPSCQLQTLQHVARYILNSLWLAGCSQIHLWQDDTKMSSLYEAGYNSNLLAYLGRTFLNSSLAWWYQIGIIICGRISLYLTRFLWQDVPKFILGRMIPNWGHWHGSNILPRVFGSHPANCRLSSCGRIYI